MNALDEAQDVTLVDFDEQVYGAVEVLLADGVVREIRHLPNTFSLSAPYRYG